VILRDAVIWDRYDTRDYLRPLAEYLEANYHRVAEGTYLSPALHALCPPPVVAR
jgi:hypothetical protein